MGEAIAHFPQRKLSFEGNFLYTMLYVKVAENSYFFGAISVWPPIYGCKAFGIKIRPSSCKLFSINAISMRGVATTVLFNVCGKYFLPLSSTRIFKRRA